VSNKKKNKRIKGNIIFSLFVTGFSAVCSFLLQILIIKNFGLASFGLFAFWRNNIQITSTIGRFGLVGQTLQRLTVLKQTSSAASIKRYYSFCFVCWLVLSICATASLLLIPFLVPPEQYILISVVSLVSLSGFVVLTAVIRVIGNLRISVCLDRVFVLLMMLLLVIITDFTGNAKDSFLYIAFTISILIAFLIAICIVVYSNHQLKIKSVCTKNSKNDDRTSWLENWKSSFKFFMLGFGGVIAQRSMILIAGIYLPAEVLGQLIFMTMLSGLISLPLLGINQILAPEVARCYANKEFMSIEKLVSVSKKYSFLTGIIIAVLVLFSFEHIQQFIGNSSVVVLPVLLIFLFTGVINAFYGPVGTSLSMIGMEGTVALIFNVSVAIKIFVMIVVVPIFSIYGIAYTELGFVLAWNLAMNVKLRAALRTI